MQVNPKHAQSSQFWKPFRATFGCIRPLVFTAHSPHPVSSSEVRSRAGQPPITTLNEQRRLKLIGHVVRADQAEDHNRELRASLNPPSDWRRPRGRPCQTWLPTISDDLKHLNLGLRSAYRQAQDHPSWRKTVETAMLT